MKGAQINQYRKNGSLFLVFELLGTKVAQDEFIAIESTRRKIDPSDMAKSDNGNPLYFVNETMRNSSGFFTPANITLTKRFDEKGYFIDTAIEDQRQRDRINNGITDKMIDYAAQLRLGIIKVAAPVAPINTPAAQPVGDNAPALPANPMEENLKVIEASELGEEVVTGTENLGG